MLVVYITFPDEATARQTAALCIEKKVAACAVCFPAQSIYVWQGQLQQEGEWVAFLKTIPEQATALEAVVEAAHPYQIPCILRWTVTANAAYEAWVQEQAGFQK
jgi:periplasmic divalent cation tolerance protein